MVVDHDGTSTISQSQQSDQSQEGCIYGGICWYIKKPVSQTLENPNSTETDPIDEDGNNTDESNES